MREKIICGLSIFFLADKAIVPTEANIPAGFSISVEPVEIFDYRDRDEFVAALWQAIQRGNPDVPNPPDEDIFKDASGFPSFKNPLELKYAQVDSWEEFERSSIYASVSAYQSGYVVEAFGRAPNGTWGEDILLNARVPLDDGLHGVVDALLAHLQTRADLPASRPNKE
jgi:hypothetical protein